MVVCLLRRQLSAHGFQGIASVRQPRQVHRHGILQVVAARQIGQLPGLEGFLSLPQREVGMVEVLEKHFHARGIHFQGKVLRLQVSQQPLHPRADGGQSGL